MQGRVSEARTGGGVLGGAGAEGKGGADGNWEKKEAAEQKLPGQWNQLESSRRFTA